MIKLFVNMLVVIMFCTTMASAEERVVDATGSYLIGDGPNESIEVAKDRAREEAMRLAAEKAGVYVESYSKINNESLTEDEVRVIAAQVLRIQKEEMTPEIIEKNHIKWTCAISAVIDMRRLDLNKMLEDRKALERASVLEKRVQDLLLENENLKRSYKLIEDISDKKKIENKIVDNQDSFKKSMLSTIGYRDGKWSYEIDPNTLYYDKTAHTVYYELIGYDNDGKKVDIRKRKIFIDTNSSMRLGTVIFYRDGRTSELRTGISKGAEIICPDEEVEYAQKKIYKYLGIQSTSVNKPTQWVYVTRWGNVFDMYYDKSNMKIDRTKGVVSLFVKDHSTDENFNAIYQVIVHINDYYFEEYNINKAGYERIESNSITQGKLFWAIRNLYYS